MAAMWMGRFLRLGECMELTHGKYTQDMCYVQALPKQDKHLLI